ncbi:DUF273 domain-containing protein [bacterium]|nr:DUF273 domain-containing protein [bacterium]
MKIGMISFGDENVEEWKSVSLPLKERYCRLHGYDFLPSHQRLDDRPVGWTKVLLMLRHLSEYDWLYWSDVDSVIMQPHRKLDEFIEHSRDLTFCVAGIHGVLNSGEFFVKNSVWARNYLETVYGQEFLVNNKKGKPKTLAHWWKRKRCGCIGCRKFQYDQKGFVHVTSTLSTQEREEHIALRRPEEPDYFNGYGENYHEGIFIQHFPGSFKNLDNFHQAARTADERLTSLELKWKENR